MNYFNPYFSAFPARGGLFSSLRGSGITLSTILNGTQRTLGIINQAIPVIKQMQPVVRNAKTMFKVMNEFKKVDTPTTSNVTNTDNTNIINESNNNQSYNNENGPTFFL